MGGEPVFVLVSGPPGSGKSTVASAVAAALDIGLVSKDTIKGALMAVLPVDDLESSRQVGRASILVMFAVAGDAPNGAVIDCNLHRTDSLTNVRQLPGPVIEVFCRCPRELAAERYHARAASRHPGHFDDRREPDDLFNDDIAEPVAGGWPVIEVDTATPVDIDALVSQLRLAR